MIKLIIGIAIGILGLLGIIGCAVVIAAGFNCKGEEIWIEPEDNYER